MGLAGLHLTDDPQTIDLRAAIEERTILTVFVPVWILETHALTEGLRTYSRLRLFSEDEADGEAGGSEKERG